MGVPSAMHGILGARGTSGRKTRPARLGLLWRRYDGRGGWMAGAGVVEWTNEGRADETYADQNARP